MCHSCSKIAWLKFCKSCKFCRHGWLNYILLLLKNTLYMHENNMYKQLINRAITDNLNLHKRSSFYSCYLECCACPNTHNINHCEAHHHVQSVLDPLHYRSFQILNLFVAFLLCIFIKLKSTTRIQLIQFRHTLLH